MGKSYKDTSKISDTALSKICLLTTEFTSHSPDSSFLKKVFFPILRDPRLLVTFCKLQDPQHEVLRATMDIPHVALIGAFIDGVFPPVTQVATEKNFLLDLLRYHAPYNPEGGVMSAFQMAIVLEDPNRPIGEKLIVKGLCSFYVSISEGVQRPEEMDEATLNLLLKFLKVFHKIYEGNFGMLIETNLPKSWEKKAKKTSRRVLQPAVGSELLTA